MSERHLLPNEIDLLLDGEVGFGVSPLRAHVEECETCRSRLADARVVVVALERLPHFAPKARFADRVLAEVQMVEPWHVAAIEAAKRLVPQSVPMRVVMAASATLVATTISASAVWLALHADAAVYAFNLIAVRIRTALVSGAGSVVGDTLGKTGLDAARLGGVTGLALGAGLALAAVGGATFGFRALATASRRSTRK
jgi:hypothetical protein